MYDQKIQELLKIKDNLFLCSYDNNQIGLFTEQNINVSKDDTYSSSRYAEVYTMIDSETKGIRIATSTNPFAFFLAKHQFITDEVSTCIATCTLKKVIAFTELCKQMYQIGILLHYKEGQTLTDLDFNQILAYGCHMMGVSPFDFLKPKKKVIKFAVDNYFVCIYDKMEIGLFQKETADIDEIYSVDVYKQVDGENVGAFLLGNRLCKNKEITLQNYNKIDISCDMIKAIPFDEVRWHMQCNHEIYSYEKKFSTTEEMAQVLEYAHTYFDIEKTKEKVKK